MAIPEFVILPVLGLSKFGYTDLKPIALLSADPATTTRLDALVDEEDTPMEDVVFFIIREAQNERL